MNINKANEISQLVNKINRCKSFLRSLDGRDYNDEFIIYYRGGETCELEESALQILIDYYKKELKNTEEQLEKL